MRDKDHGRDMHAGPSTEFLANLVLRTAWDDLSPQVRHEAKRALLNYFAVCLGGCNDRVIETAVRVLAPLGGGRECSVVGRPERVDLLSAAMLNAMSANVFDFDDTHVPTIVHPTAPVVPAISALAQSRRVTGAQFLSALVVGIEVECRIANAVSPGHYARGWHITSTCGVFGAAAASGRILALDGQHLAWALGNASAQACGLVETLGTSAKSLSVGNASRNGLLSALLAQQGFEGPRDPLEGERGFLRVFTDTLRIDAIASETEWQWELMRNTYKPYPCGVVLNPVIDACLALSAQVEVSSALNRIAEIEITGHPLLQQRTNRPGVQNGRQAQVSAQHAVGAVLNWRRAGLEEFSDDAVRQQTVRALGEKVRFHDDASMSIDAATVRVRMADGRSFAHTVDAASGSLVRPMSDRDIEDKLRSLCAYGRCGIDPQPLIEAVWAIEESQDVSRLLELASTA